MRNENGQFVKGHSYNKGIVRTEKYKKKMSQTLKGRKLSKETRQNMSRARKKEWLEGKRVISPKWTFRGNKHTKEWKEKKGESKKNIWAGDRNPKWCGGIAKNPYPPEFNKELKQRIRERDNFTCCLCGRTEREELEELNQVLCVNHIDYNKQNCKENNLNTLCLRCNSKINRDREYWTNYFNKLYEPSI